MLIEEIDPNALYGFAVCCKVLPSRNSKRLSLRTLHRWATRGLIKFVERDMPWGRTRFMEGHELLRLAAAPNAPRMRSAAEKKRGVEAAYKELERMGVKIRREPK